LKVMGRWSGRTIGVIADGTGLCSRAGAVLFALVADRLGLTAGLCDALAGTRERGGGHEPGRVFGDLAVMLADGVGACLIWWAPWSVLVVRRRRVGVDGTAGDALDRGVRARGDRAARAAARARAWEAGPAPERVILDFDAALIDVHSEGAGGRSLPGRGRV
jgi:hypothetical protein